MLGGALGANAVEHHRVAFKRKAFFLGNFLLAFFNFGIGKLDYLAAIGANQVIVMIAVV
jgi:hypothetical protein